MHDVRKLDALFAALEARYGIANLRLPAHGAVGLRLKDGSELCLEYEEARGTLYAYSSIMPLPIDEVSRLKVFAAMLALNFLDAGIERGALSVHNDTAVCHVRLDVADLQFEEFDQALQTLLVSRADIAKQLEAGMTAETPKAARAARSTSTLLAAFR